MGLEVGVEWIIAIRLQHEVEQESSATLGFHFLVIFA
jgi:hypothetical protein